MTVTRLTKSISAVTVERGGRDYVSTQKGEEGIVLYGPYEERDAGRYVVEFEIKSDGRGDALGNPVCAVLDVVCNYGQTVLAEKRLLLSHIEKEFTRVNLEFALHERRVVEYRVSTTGQTGITTCEDVCVSPVRQGALPPGASALEREWKNEQEFLDGYLRNVTGLIHVGANTGQERRYYWLMGLDVLWVEPIKEFYDRLVDNLAGYPRQRPVNALLADEDGKEFDFKIANNDGASSSVLPLEDHATIFPDIRYVEERRLTSLTLKSLMAREGASLGSYQALTLDVEGAELLVLKGARGILHGFKYIKCEVADFPARTGTPTVDDLDEILAEAGFAQIIRRAFALGPNNRGTYWDIVWKRIVPGLPLNEPGVLLPLVAHPKDVEGIEKLPG